MQPFRFPRVAIVTMLLLLLTTIFAIEQGRHLAMGYAVDLHFEIDWPRLFLLFGFLALPLFSVAAIGYGVLRALRQSGEQRLSNIRTGAQRR